MNSLEKSKKKKKNELFSKQRLNIACVKTLVLRIQIAFLSDHLSQVSILFQTSLKDKLLQSGDLSFKIVQIAS